MIARKDYISKYADKRLIRSNRLIRTTVLFMLLVVLYDSFVFSIPLYYILFIAACILIGRVFYFSHRVEFDKNEIHIKVRTNYLSTVVLLLILLARFIIGPYIEGIAFCMGYRCPVAFFFWNLSFKMAGNH